MEGRSRVVDRRPWLRIKERWEAGEAIPVAVRELAEAALGERFLRPAPKGHRPDFRDREAGDRSFDDDDGVML